MGMNIVVMSPHTRRAGNTTVASLIAMKLASKNRSTCLTNSRFISKEIYSYFKLSETSDKTTNPHRLVKMLRESAVKPEEINDYCKEVADKFSVFCSGNTEFSTDEVKFLADYITEYFPYDYIVYDFDSDYKNINNEVEQTILKRADIVVMVVEPNRVELEKFKDRSREILKCIGKKPIIMCINKYSGVIETIKDIGSYMGVKSPNRWTTLRYNPYIQYGTNHGTLKGVFDAISTEDLRVIDIASDINNISSAILKVKVMKRTESNKTQMEIMNSKNKGKAEDIKK